MRAARHGLKRVQLGLVAQVLTLVATLLPVLAGQTDALVFAVQAGGLASILISIVTAGAAVRLPAVLEDKRAATETLSSLVIVGCSGLLCLVVVGTLHLIGSPELALVGLAALLLLVSQSLYVVGAAVLTRQGSYASLMQMRLLYAVVAVLLTAMVTAVDAGGFALVGASIAGFLVGAAIPARSILRASREALTIGWRPSDASRSLVESRSLLASFLFGGLGTQLPAVFITSLGEYAAAWAVVIRMSGGIQTVALQLIAPAVDIKVSRAYRVGAAGDARQGVRLGFAAGGLLALVTAAAPWIGLQFITVDLDPWAWLAFWSAVLGFAATGSLIGPCSRTLPMIGGTGETLRWNVGRTMLAAGAFYLPAPSLTLVTLGVGGAALAAYYMVKCFALASRIEAPRAAAT